MLKSLRLQNVGPAPEMELELAPRLNLITGDNGLGKSFLLDVAWWALTRTWARGLVLPRAGSTGAEISYAYPKRSPGRCRQTSSFNRETEEWSVRTGRSLTPGLVLYAQVDGGYSVWDPARNSWKTNTDERPAAYLFAPNEVWDGNAHCEGLVRDWASWQREQGEPFEALSRVLETLSPSPNETLRVGDLRKLTLGDPKRYPTLRMPYGEDVAVVHASAGMRRILALSYLLIWTWQEHVAAAELRGESPTEEIVFLVDEIEAHLHPQWQRCVVPAILKVVNVLLGGRRSGVQLLAVTHSPLVLASAEPFFDAGMDAWFDLDLEDRAVVLRKREFVRHGEVGNWLTSEAFDLREPRSLEGEQAIQAALSIIRDSHSTEADIQAVQRRLHAAGIPDIDPFWVRWGYFIERTSSLAQPRAKSRSKSAFE